MPSRNLPARWAKQITSQLEAGEVVLAWFLCDLNSLLRYSESCLVLTNRRLIDLEKENMPPGEKPRSWRVDDVKELGCRDRAGLGTLELEGPHGALAQWRYTVERAVWAHKLARRLERLKGEADDLPDWDDWEEDGAIGAPAVGVFIRLLRFARPRANLLVLGFILTWISTAIGLVSVYLGKPLTELLTGEMPGMDADERMKWVLIYLACLAVAAIATWLLSWSQGWVMSIFSERISSDLRNKAYAHLQRLSLEYFGGRRTGDLISRISNDTDEICLFLSDKVVDFASDVLMILGMAGILFYLNPYLALAAMLPLPFNAYVVLFARERMQHGILRRGRAWAEMTSILADTIPGIRVVKAFAQENREIDRFQRTNDRIIEANDKVNFVWTFFWPMIAMLNQFGLLVVWAVGAWLVFYQQSALTGGVFVVFLASIARIYTRLEAMSRMLSYTQRAAAGAGRLFEILDRVSTVPEPTNPVHPKNLKGEIEFRDVSFRHGSRPVLENINLSIAAKEMIGLVGPSGAGKSTLVNLVCRFYDVAEGAILVDGTDIRSFPVEEYREHIGLVLQDPFLFYGSVAENIAYGRPDATRDEIVAAAKAARAHEFILRLPMGYDSIVGERGQMLSGGERQRISIARALLIDPEILILDEATSSVDTETEREIQLALDHLIQGRTTIAIAHRLSTLRKADRLVVLDRGRIVEIGKHNELMEREGIYWRLHQAQQEHVMES